MDSNRFKTVFPIGSHLCREPMPSMSEMKRDMEILKKKGFNLIKLQEQWKIDEPEEGMFDFSRYDELINYAQKLDLGVYLGLTCEQAPPWLYEKYPEANMVRRDGLVLDYQSQTACPADGKPGPCFDHDGTMEAQTTFIKALVKHLSQHENIVIWNTWQEIGYEAERIIGDSVCYCKNTITKFQQWLKGTYGHLDNLNKAWNSRYTRWKDVVPNRHVGRFCLPNNIMYKYFLHNVRLQRILESRARAIKETDPYNRPVFAHQGSSTVGSGIDWNYAKSQDFLGCSCYPAWFHVHQWDDLERKSNDYQQHDYLLNEMWESVSLKFDYLRSCNQEGSPIWAAEFQGGPISVGLYKGRTPSAKDIRNWMLTAVGSGATAISFWVTRPEIQGHEVNGYSLLDSTGDTTERLEEASRIGKALNQYGSLFNKATTPKAKVSILVDEHNFRLCTTVKGEAEEHLTYSMRGWHKYLWQSGIYTDFIELNQVNRDKMTQYELLILPFPLSISEEIAMKLKAYVQDGGQLICEACPGRLTEYGYANRGELSKHMQELLGVQQQEIWMIQEPDNGERWKMGEFSKGDYKDHAILQGTGRYSGKASSNVYVETYKCINSEPILEYNGKTVGTMNAIGKGRAYLIGTFLGHSATAYANDYTKSFIGELLEDCHIQPAHEGKLLLRKRVEENREAWIFTNPTKDRVRETIKVGENKKVTDLFGDVLLQNDEVITLEVDSLDIQVIIVENT